MKNRMLYSPWCCNEVDIILLAVCGELVISPCLSELVIKVGIVDEGGISSAFLTALSLLDA